MSRAEPPQLPATMEVTPMRTKFSASGRSQMSSAWVWTSMNPGASVRPVASSTSFAGGRGRSFRPRRSVRRGSRRRRGGRASRAVDHRGAGDHQVVLRRLRPNGRRLSLRRLRRSANAATIHSPGVHADVSTRRPPVSALTSRPAKSDGDHADRIVPEERHALGRRMEGEDRDDRRSRRCRPANAPWPLTRLNASARTNTPSSDP